MSGPKPGHFVSATCQGEKCVVCGFADATHKVGEEIPFDDPIHNRHNLTAYVCCGCFRMLFGDAVLCDPEKTPYIDAL